MMIKKLNINERILYIIENQFNDNKKKFAEHINFAPQVIFNIVSGRKSSPSYDVLNAILTTNDDIDANWLLTGRGEMFRQENKTQLENINVCNCREILHLNKINELQDFKIKALEQEISFLKKVSKV